MPDQKLSELTADALPLATTDLFYVVQTTLSPASRKIAFADLGEQLFLNALFTGYADFAAIAEPAAPAGDILRLWNQNTQGFSQLRTQIASGHIMVIGQDMFMIVRNVTGSTIPDGSVVYVSGTTGTIPQISLAKSDNILTLPAIGIVMGNIANNSFGIVHTHGIVHLDTSGFTDGQVVWVSATVAGALTETEPVAPFQQVGVVIKAAVAGQILLDISSPTIAHTLLDADEHADTTVGVPVAGDIIAASGSPAKWGRVAKGSGSQVWAMDPGATGPAWRDPSGVVTAATNWHSIFMLMGA